MKIEAQEVIANEVYKKCLKTAPALCTPKFAMSAAMYLTSSM